MAGLAADLLEDALARDRVGRDDRLRHTFCSLLAMPGAPARAIQGLAEHQDLSTTQRYMHLSPAAIEGAIRLLEMRGPAEAGRHVLTGGRGDILETADA